jgi:hypothetical protein
VTTALSSEDQLTEPLMFLVLPSSYVPVAVIRLVLPTETEGVAGVTVMSFNVGLTKNPLQLVRLMVARTSDTNPSNTRDTPIRRTNASCSAAQL